MSEKKMDWIEVDIEEPYDSSDTKELVRYDLGLLIPPEQAKGLPDTIPRSFSISHELIRSNIDYLYTFTGRDLDYRIIGIQYASTTDVNQHSLPSVNAPPVLDAL
jgi:hypothetical protein